MDGQPVSRPAHHVSPRIPAIAALLAAWIGLTGVAQPAPSGNVQTAEQQYHQALRLARAGHHRQALDRLARLVERFPDERRYLHDYLAVLGWAQRDQEILDLLHRVDMEAAPPYVLETIGKAARNLQRFPLAIEAYRSALAKAPGRVAARIGLALTLADSGAADEALTELDALGARGQRNLDVLAARAYVLRTRGNLFEALATYEAMLRIDPDNETARRGRILVTLRLGAPHLAAALAAGSPGLLRPDELEAIERDRLAIALRWGRLAPLADTDPEQELRDTVAALRDKVTRLENEGAGDAPAARHARHDLIVGLYELHRPDEALAVFESLAEGRPPAYVLATAGRAYLELRRPEQARDLLLQALAQNPDDFESRLSLFYAYIDTESFADALALIDRLAASEPAWLGTPPHRRANPRKLQADTTAALGRAFADQPAQAQHRLDDLVLRAPHNTDLRTERAFVQLWRGRPRRALEEFELVLNDEPAHFNARTGRIEALLALDELGQAGAALRAIKTRHPRHPQVRALDDTWQVVNSPTLRIESGRGTSSGVQEGTDQSSLDAWLYSPPIAYRYRAFTHGRYALADFPEGRAIYRRLGAGLTYRMRGLRWTAELDRNAANDAEAGLAFDTEWAPTDQWSFGLALDSYSDDIPLRGRLAEAIDGRGIALGARWQGSESQRLRLGIQRTDFSDDNRRESLQITGFQRLVSRPHYKLDGLIEVYTSRNSRVNAPYFNPLGDFSTDATLTQEWLLHRRYDRAFRHRLATTLGSYRQRGFGAAASWALRYEHQWDLDGRTGLVYGLGRARRIYDGAAEYQWNFHLNLDWRF